MKGQLAVEGEEFSSALDVSLDRIDSDDFLAMWPPDVVSDTRDWLGENLLGGVIKDASVSFRVRGAEEPVVGVGFTFGRRGNEISTRTTADHSVGRVRCADRKAADNRCGSRVHSGNG